MKKYIQATDKQAAFLIDREIGSPSAGKRVFDENLYLKTKAVIHYDSKKDACALALECFSVPKKPDGEWLSARSGEKLFARYHITQEQLQAYCASPEKAEKVYDLLGEMKRSGDMVYMPSKDGEISFAFIVKNHRPLFGDTFRPDSFEQFDIGDYLHQRESILKDMYGLARQFATTSRLSYRLGFTIESDASQMYAGPADGGRESLEKIERLTGVKMPVTQSDNEAYFWFTPFVACDEKSVQMDKTTSALVTNPYLYNYRSDDTVQHRRLIPAAEAAAWLKEGVWSAEEQDGKKVWRGVAYGSVGFAAKECYDPKTYAGSLCYRANDIHVLYGEAAKPSESARYAHGRVFEEGADESMSPRPCQGANVNAYIQPAEQVGFSLPPSAIGNRAPAGQFKSVSLTSREWLPPHVEIRPFNKEAHDAYVRQAVFYASRTGYEGPPAGYAEEDDFLF